MGGWMFNSKFDEGVILNRIGIYGDVGCYSNDSVLECGKSRAKVFVCFTDEFDELSHLEFEIGFLKRCGKWVVCLVKENERVSAGDEGGYDCGLKVIELFEVIGDEVRVLDICKEVVKIFEAKGFEVFDVFIVVIG
jgi:hypothetical protein